MFPGNIYKTQLLGVALFPQRSWFLIPFDDHFGDLPSDSDWLLKVSHIEDEIYSRIDSAVSSYTHLLPVAQLLLIRHRLSASSGKNTPQHELSAEHLSLLPDSGTGFFFQHLPSTNSRRSRFRQHIRQQYRSFLSFLTHTSEPAEQEAPNNETSKKELYVISEEAFREAFKLDKDKIVATRDCSCRQLLEIQVQMPQQALDKNVMYSELRDSSVVELPGTPFLAPRYAELPAPTYDYNVASTYSEPLTVHTAQTATAALSMPILSPHCASEGQSPVSPFTASTTARIPESTHVINSNALLRNECYGTPNHMRWSYGAPAAAMIADQSVHSLNLSALTFLGNYFGFDAANRESLDFEQRPSASYTPTLVQNKVQRTVTLPSRMPAPQSVSFKPRGPPIGTWHRNPDATWSRCDDEASTLCTNDDESNGYFKRVKLSRDHEDHNMLELELEEDEVVSQLCPQPTGAKKKRERQYALVYCKHCEKCYSGRYARGNMKRHVLLKHTLKMGKPFKCSMCEKAYNRSDARRNHERLKHSILGHLPPTSRSASSASST